MMIPTEMLIIPWYIMSNKLGWVNSYWGIMFPGMMTGFGTFLMRQFFQSVPDELLDAGRIDGLNEFQLWWKIAMPLVKPAISALAIFTFLGNWNAFLWPLIVTSQTELYTLPVGLAFFSGEFQTEWEMVMTGASVATIPVLIVFLIFQKQIVEGISLSGLKG
jgi:multiple sugar transport system permease protein